MVRRVVRPGRRGGAGEGSEGIQAVFEATLAGLCLVPVTKDAPALLDAGVGQGCNGIVRLQRHRPKERTSLHRPSVRSPAWLELKPKLSPDMVVTGGHTGGNKNRKAFPVALTRCFERVRSGWDGHAGERGNGNEKTV